MTYDRKTPVQSATYFIPKQQQWTLRSIEEVLNNPDQLGFVYKETEGLNDIAWDHRKGVVLFQTFTTPFHPVLFCFILFFSSKKQKVWKKT